MSQSPINVNNNFCLVGNKCFEIFKSVFSRHQMMREVTYIQFAFWRQLLSEKMKTPFIRRKEDYVIQTIFGLFFFTLCCVWQKKVFLSVVDCMIHKKSRYSWQDRRAVYKTQMLFVFFIDNGKCCNFIRVCFKPRFNCKYILFSLSVSVLRFI